MPRRKRAGGHVQNSKRTMAYADIIRIRTFINNYAEEHALVLPGRVPGFKRGDLRLLPSVNMKASIWRDSYKPVRFSQAAQFVKAGLASPKELYFSRGRHDRGSTDCTS